MDPELPDTPEDEQGRRRIPGTKVFVGADGTLWSRRNNESIKMTVFMRHNFPTVRLWYPETRTATYRQVNRLVASLFLEPPPPNIDRPSIWHIDGNVLNCSSENLRWDSWDRVRAWNNMHKAPLSWEFSSSRIWDKETNIVYENARVAGIILGRLEGDIVKEIEANHDWYETEGRLEYVKKNDDISGRDFISAQKVADLVAMRRHEHPL